MPGISTVINVKDHFTSSLTAYRKLASAASKSNFQLAKAAVSTAYQNKGLLKSAADLTAQYAPLIGSQKMVTTATMANDVAFGHLYRTIDRLYDRFYDYLPILKIVGMFVPQIGMIVKQIERGELSINDVYDIVDQFKLKVEDFIQNLPKKLEKLSKWANRISGLLKFVSVMSSKTMLIKVGLLGIAATWAIINRQKLKSLVVDSAMYKKAVELSKKYGQMAQGAGRKAAIKALPMVSNAIGNVKSRVNPLLDKGATFANDKIGVYGNQAKKIFASISEDAKKFGQKEILSLGSKFKSSMKNGAERLIEVWPDVEKKAMLAMSKIMTYGSKAFSHIGAAAKRFWYDETTQKFRQFFGGRFVEYFQKGLFTMENRLMRFVDTHFGEMTYITFKNSAVKMWTRFKELAASAFLAAKAKAVWFFRFMSMESTKMWIKDFIVKAGLSFVVIGSSFKKIFTGSKVKQAIRDLFSDMKQVSKITSKDISKILWTAFRVYLTYRAIKGYVDFLKMWSNAYQKVNEVMDNLLEKMDEVERHNKRLRTFGEEGSRAFEKYARKMSESWGVAKKDIEDVGLKLRKLKLSGNTMNEIFDFTNVLSKIKGESFEEVGSTIANAIATRSVEDLAEILGGGRKIEKELRKLGISKLMKQGKVKEAMEKFKELAGSMGYTQELADKISDSLPGKVRKIKSIMDGYGSDFKKAFLENIEPFLDEFMEFITSPEFKEFADSMTRQFLAMVKIVGSFLKNVISVGLAFYKWWISPSGNFLKMTMMFLGMSGALVKISVVLKAIAGAGGLLSRFLVLSRGLGTVFAVVGKSIVTSVIPPLKNVWGIQKKNVALSKLFAKNMGKALLAFLANPMVLIPAMLFAGVLGAKKLTETLTGETKPAVESLVDVFVGGITHGSLTILQGWKKIVNAFISSFARDWNNLLDVLQKVGNWGWKFSVKLKEKMLDAKIGFLKFIETAQSKIIEMLDTITNNPVYKTLFGDGFQKTMSSGIAEQIAELQKEKAELLSGHADTLEAMFERNGDTESHFLDQYKWNPELLDIASQKQIAKVTAGQIEKTLNSDIAQFMRNAQEMVTDLLGFGATKDAKLDEIIQLMGESNDNTGALRDHNRRELDLRWMKEMAEQRFVNDVNIRQLTPTIKVEVSGDIGSAKDLADVLDQRLSEMAQRGTFNAYGDAG